MKIRLARKILRHKSMYSRGKYLSAMRRLNRSLHPWSMEEVHVEEGKVVLSERVWESKPLRLRGVQTAFTVKALENLK